MKSFVLILFAFVFSAQLRAQINPLFLEPTREQADSYIRSLVTETNDTLRMAACRELALFYLDTNTDSAMFYIKKSIPLAKQLKLQLWEADATDLYAIISRNKGLYVQSLKAYTKALALVEDKKSEKNIWKISNFTNSKSPELARLSMNATILSDMVDIYRAIEDYDKQYSTTMRGMEVATSINDYTLLSLLYESLGEIDFRNNQLDSALLNFNKSLEFIEKSGYRKYESGVYKNIGNTYFMKEQFSKSRNSYFKGLSSAKKTNNKKSISTLYIALANLYNATSEYDSALYYAKDGLIMLEEVKNEEGLGSAYTMMAETYRKLGINDSAWTYLKLATAAKDSLFNSEKIKQLQNIGFDEQLHLQELEQERIEAEGKLRTYTLLFSLGVFAIIAFLLYRNNRQKRKANVVLEKALSNLKATQSQLVQSEKMASLGELTAGIAHEIQNPLNFVNNFSEVNQELITELRDEISNKNYNEVDELAQDVQANEEKIMHHGKRADAIVKGMLQHSRSSSGVKEPTDINALADEYLRLAYHGLRAKDKSFNATMHTDFDEVIGNIDVIPQDIGRVVLNLITNAFYVVDEKKKSGAENYEPTVSVSTKKISDKVLISVKDNGNGIAANVVDKIFQPFFTTKPTGQGTGLGLSMSYDIVTKSHHGELKVETKEGKGSEFIIVLPKNT